MSRIGKIGALAVIVIALGFFAQDVAQNRRTSNHLRAANEYAAVSRLGKLNNLQTQYAAAHKNAGFACRLSDLAALDEKLALRSFYDDGRLDGYVFSMSGCDAAKPNHHYEIVAVPVIARDFGTKSFCTNESGVVFRDDDTAGIHCLSDGKPLN